MSVMCKKSPHMAAMFFDRSNFCEQFRKGHQRNIPVKLFPNWTWDLREDFLKISLCSYSSKSLPPPPMTAMFFGRSDFREQFLNGFTKGIFL